MRQESKERERKPSLPATAANTRILPQRRPLGQFQLPKGDSLTRTVPFQKTSPDSHSARELEEEGGEEDDEEAEDEDIENETGEPLREFQSEVAPQLFRSSTPVSRRGLAAPQNLEVHKAAPVRAAPLIATGGEVAANPLSFPDHRPEPVVPSSLAPRPEKGHAPLQGGQKGQGFPKVPAGLMLWKERQWEAISAWFRKNHGDVGGHWKAAKDTFSSILTDILHGFMALLEGLFPSYVTPLVTKFGIEPRVGKLLLFALLLLMLWQGAWATSVKFLSLGGGVHLSISAASSDDLEFEHYAKNAWIIFCCQWILVNKAIAFMVPASSLVDVQMYFELLSSCCLFLVLYGARRLKRAEAGDASGFKEDGHTPGDSKKPA